jgi:anti-sigma factor RsiW
MEDGMTAPLGCREVREGLTEYLDAALSPERRQGYDAHLAACASCRRFLGELRATVEALSGLPREPMPAEAKRRLSEALRQRRSA